MKGKTFSLLLAALVFAFLLQTAADNGINQKNVPEVERLQQLAGSNGEVRVIVKLNVPGIKELTAASNRFCTVVPGKEAEWGGALADMELEQAITKVADSVLYNLGGTEYKVNHTYSSIPYLALSVSEEALAILESLPEVLDIEEDQPIRLLLPVKGGPEQVAKDGTSTPVNRDQTRLDNTVSIIGADTAWGMGYTGSGWYVAILDTGIRSSHEFFTGKTIVEACYALGEDGVGPAGDCPNGNITMTGTGSAVHHPSTYAGWDHGTHVSGIATGSYGTLHGVAKDANIIAVQVFSKFSASACGGSPCVMSWNSDSLAGLDYVYSIRGSYSIAAANMSLGGGAYSSPCDGDSRKAAIDNLRAAGIATAIATGNDGYCGYVSSPSCVSTCVSVGASTDGDAEAYFNNWHATMQRLFAPGYSVYSSTGDSNSSYESWNGTSMATPHVAGTWALLKQYYPTGSVTDLLAALRNTGVGITSVCDGYTTPIPRIQVDAAINSLAVITVTSPNGGEIWGLGSVQNITWTASGLSDNVQIILQQNGTTVALIAEDIDPASGSYPWTVGDCVQGTVNAGANYKIMVKEKNSSVLDRSDASFEIISGSVPIITVTSPNGGENLVLGSTHNITWSCANLSNNIHIILQQNNTNVALIAKNIDPAPGSYSWTVGDCLKGAVSAGANFKMLIREVGTSVKDKSDSFFDISTPPPSITVTSPNGGEEWQIGTAENITWTYYGLSNNIHIVLQQNDTNVALIAKDIDPAPGTYSWMVGDCIKGAVNPGTNYKIMIMEKGTTVKDKSDGYFNILPGTEADWTFMVYLDADNNLESVGIDDFLEMSSVGSTADVNIVVQFDRISGYDSSYDDWTSTKRFYITSGMTPSAANALEDIGEANMGDPTTLDNFVNWAKTNFPATNYALIMWNHGGGWRDSKKELWQERKKDKKNDLIFKAVCWDDTDGGDCLYMSEVRSALSSCGSAQLIGFDACLMGMVEVAYEIKNYGQVMVGSEETEPGAGWPYNTIVSDLTSNPSWSASQLGSAIVDRYYASYGNDWTQAAIDLTNLNTLASTISTFADSMIDDYTNEAAVKSAALDVITQIDNTVINEKHGSSWPGAHGLAIYFPETAGEFDPDYNGTVIEFPNDTQWEEFLEEFHTSMTGSWITTRRESSQEFYYDEHVDLYHFCELLQLDQGDYYTESQITNAFAGGGTGQGFREDDSYITYSLPFDFRYFGQTFSSGSTIYISSNGYVDFDAGSDHSDYLNSTSALAANKRIAPCWEDLRTDGSAQTGEDVYITENTDNVVILWKAETWGSGDPVNVELVLYDDGRIQFNYGGGNTNLYPTIGISKGDTINYYLSVYDGQSTLTNVDSDLFTPIAATIRVLSPNGGETWSIGSSENITWDTTGVVGNVRIALYKDEALLGLIADDIDSTLGTYAWTVGSYSGGTATAGTGYKIKIKEVSEPTSDTSDSAFTLSD